MSRVEIRPVFNSVESSVRSKVNNVAEVARAATAALASGVRSQALTEISVTDSLVIVLYLIEDDLLQHWSDNAKRIE